MRKENWLPIKGYEGHYEVSNHGRVKSLARIVATKRGVVGRKEKERILKPGGGIGNYKNVRLCINSVKITHIVHRLVAKAFILPVEGKLFVNHIDGIRGNNIIDNLEWCTSSENTKHSYSTLNQRSPHTGRFGKDSHKSIPIIKLSRLGEEISRHSCAADVHREEGINASSISACARGRLKTAGNFKWAYAGQ